MFHDTEFSHFTCHDSNYWTFTYQEYQASGIAKRFGNWSDRGIGLSGKKMLKSRHVKWLQMLLNLTLNGEIVDTFLLSQLKYTRTTMWGKIIDGAGSQRATLLRVPEYTVYHPPLREPFEFSPRRSWHEQHKL